MCLTRECVSPENVSHQGMCLTRECVSPENVSHQRMCLTRECVSPENVSHQRMCLTRECLTRECVSPDTLATICNLTSFDVSKLVISYRRGANFHSVGTTRRNETAHVADCVWNVMAHAQKPDFVFRRNGRVHLNRQGHQFSRLLAGELCTSACRVCTARASLCSAVMWRLLVTHSILLFPLYFSSRVSPRAITFQTQSTP
jgi:hypothetical protein